VVVPIVAVGILQRGAIFQINHLLHLQHRIGLLADQMLSVQRVGL
jgi:hypothetical protein